MLVIPQDDGSLVVAAQAEHAAASAALAEAWVRPERVPAEVWQRFIETVRRHDDGWTEYERLPLLSPEGVPLDFLGTPTPRHVEVWWRSIDLAEVDDVFAALLVAHHARRLYTTHPPEDQIESRLAAEQFILEATQRIDHYLDYLRSGNVGDRMAMEPHNLAVTHELLLTLDTLTLALAGAVAAPAATLPVWFGQTLAAVQCEWSGAAAGVVRLTPWPFASPVVEVCIVGRRLARGRFESPQDMAHALPSAPPESLRWRIEPGAA